jgi:hypothetical protein
MTTPPTTAQVDTYVQTGSNFANLFSNSPGPQVTTDMVAWVVAYTDNASNKHYEGLGVYEAGAIGATNAELEATSVVVANGGGPFYSNSADIQFEPLPYLRYLVDSYGAIILRGYLIPAATIPAAVNSTVQAWVNNTANWPAAG